MVWRLEINVCMAYVNGADYASEVNQTPWGSPLLILWALRSKKWGLRSRRSIERTIVLVNSFIVLKRKESMMLPEKRLSKATPEEEVLTVQKVRDVTEAYQSFEDMLKGFNREDLVALWSLVKERFRSVEPTEDMEKALWVELKRLFEPDKDDVLWKLKTYMHDPLT
ncbi:hypothetical protein Tco_0474226 [Tanacetum coccineum]